MQGGRFRKGVGVHETLGGQGALVRPFAVCGTNPVHSVRKGLCRVDLDPARLLGTGMPNYEMLPTMYGNVSFQGLTIDSSANVKVILTF